MSYTLRLTLSGTTWSPSTSLGAGRWEHGVKRALLEVDGVEGVTTSSQASLVGVAFDASKVTPDLIRERIESLGTT